ncbi:uncharacterized protein V1513DRAFT_333242 [Lipomyces chichibuensis]|uniref:uncharacterized protein n=1 Tax=Lipomyces chichibuensis TaxID=1546026 RepID=UPI0033442993
MMLRFQELKSFISCLAHVLSLIVKDILEALTSRDTSSSSEACDQIARGWPIDSHSALSRLRILSPWILRTPQRREGWTNLCFIHGLNDKCIRRDVETDGIRHIVRFKVVHLQKNGSDITSMQSVSYLRLRHEIGSILRKLQGFWKTSKSLRTCHLSKDFQLA